MAVLRNNLPGLSLGSLRDLLERAQGDVLKALSGLAQQELAVPAPRQQVSRGIGRAPSGTIRQAKSSSC